ncbi:MAG: hypothetical protein ABJN42_29745 [Roseibium sp.]|uniref:hypothetical protein n=1 Tax=Roseibium sp. TaxID=1936156 RepID=UPI0032995817
MANEEKKEKEVRTTPYAVAGKKDESKLYVQISHTSEETRKVLKDDLGAKFMGGNVNKWEVDKATYEGAIEKVDAAYAKDSAARAEAAANKPAKAELTEEEKAAKEAEKKARFEARDASRVMVDADSVAIGDKVKKDDAEHEVNHIGNSFEKDGKNVAYAYFGDLGAEMAAKAAEKEAEKEVDDTPTP